MKHFFSGFLFILLFHHTTFCQAPAEWLARFDELMADAEPFKETYNYQFYSGTKLQLWGDGSRMLYYKTNTENIWLATAEQKRAVFILDRFGKDSVSYVFNDSLFYESDIYWRDSLGELIYINSRYIYDGGTGDTSTNINIFYHLPYGVRIGSHELYPFHRDLIDANERFALRYYLYDSLGRKSREVCGNFRGDSTYDHKRYDYFNGYYIVSDSMPVNGFCPEYRSKAEAYSSPCKSRLIVDFKDYSLTDKKAFLLKVLTAYWSMLTACDCQESVIMLNSPDKKINITIRSYYQKKYSPGIGLPTGEPGNWEGWISLTCMN